MSINYNYWEIIPSLIIDDRTIIIKSLDHNVNVNIIIMIFIFFMVI